ncbi:MAG: hypothetical protein NC400_13600 [Clostridium sp.]|nr:hypothetical protein [Clostridium sp.]
MKTKKKNRFLTFCFSLIPGAAEMYMGFMKTGLCLMLLFAILIMLTAWLMQGVLSTLAVVAWFYSFFHANHLASLNDDEFDEVKDEYLFGLDSLPGINNFVKKNQRWIAYILIFLGACFLWNSTANLLRDFLPERYYFISRIMWRIGDYVPSFLVGIGIIVLGIKMIGGKKERPLLENHETKEQETKEREARREE